MTAILYSSLEPPANTALAAKLKVRPKACAKGHTVFNMDTVQWLQAGTWPAGRPPCGGHPDSLPSARAAGCCQPPAASRPAAGTSARRCSPSSPPRGARRWAPRTSRVRAAAALGGASGGATWAARALAWAGEMAEALTPAPRETPYAPLPLRSDAVRGSGGGALLGAEADEGEEAAGGVARGAPRPRIRGLGEMARALPSAPRQPRDGAPRREYRRAPKLDRALARRGRPGMGRVLHEALLLALLGVFSSALAFAIDYGARHLVSLRDHLAHADVSLAARFCSWVRAGAQRPAWRAGLDERAHPRRARPPSPAFPPLPPARSPPRCVCAAWRPCACTTSPRTRSAAGSPR